MSYYRIRILVPAVLTLFVTATAAAIPPGGTAIAEFRFAAPDPARNSAGDGGVAGVSWHNQAGAEDGLLRLKPRAVRRIPAAELSVYQGLPGAWGIAFDLALDTLERDQYILGMGTMYLRFQAHSKSLQFGVLGDRWHEIALPLPELQPGRQIALTADADGKRIRLRVGGKEVEMPCTAVPQGIFCRLGCAGWDSPLASEMEGTIASLQLYRLEYFDPVFGVDPEPTLDSLALFAFSNGFTETTGRGARIQPGATAQIVPADGGSLRLTPRRETSQARTLAQLPATKMPGFRIEVDVKMRANGPIPLRDMVILSANGFFLRYSVDRQTFEYGFTAVDKWICAATTRDRLEIAMNRWYRIGCEYGDGKLRLSIDGNECAVAEIPATPALPRVLTLGSYAWGDELNTEFDGWIGSLHISTVPER